MNTLDALPKLIERLLALECTQKASVKFVDSPRDVAGSIAAQRSSYRKLQNDHRKQQSDHGKPQIDHGRRQLKQRGRYEAGQRCKGCGMQNHGSGKSMVRDQDCPAWGRKCHNCKQENHFQSVCRGNKSQTAVAINEDSDDDEEVSFLSATRSRSDSI
jgi:hypothetical protein